MYFSFLKLSGNFWLSSSLAPGWLYFFRSSSLVPGTGKHPLACREMCGSLRTRRGLLQEYRKETLKKMLLRPPNLDFITQRNRSTPKETISKCSRKKCHFNMKVLLWKSREWQNPVYNGSALEKNSSVITPLDKQVTQGLLATAEFFNT